MNILLVAINAKYIHSNLAVYSLKAYAEEYEAHIHLAEYTINHRVDYILQEIYKQKPEVLCFSCYIWNFRYVQELITELHKLLPKLPIWVGGPEVSYEPELFLNQYPMVTGVMVGEGEATFKELCGYYVQKRESMEVRVQSLSEAVAWSMAQKKAGEMLEGIPGLIFRGEKGNLARTPKREPVSMDELPFCYEHLEEFQNRIIYYETSRGCPFSCSYCLSSIEKGLRFRSFALVEKELMFFLEHQVPQVKFVDRTFNCNHEHAMNIWRFIKEHDNGITNFHFEISADLLNEEEIELIGSMRPGLIQLEIGVQSTHEPTIREIHRTMNLSRLESVVKSVQGAGNVHQHLDLIAGLPLENFETFANSFCEIYQLKPEQLQLGFLKVLKGSYMYEHRKEYGLVYQEHPPYEVMSTNWLSYDEVLKIKLVEEMLDVYYNSGQFEMTMKVLELLDNPFMLFLRLGEFYESHGLFAMSHSRIRRCEILLEFLEEADREHLELYQETLTFDLYYRENMKSRPKWAPDLARLKEMKRELFEKKECLMADEQSIKKENQRSVEAGAFGQIEISRKMLESRQFHLEPFSYNMEELLRQKSIIAYPQKQRNSQFYLFSYEERSPLTGQAKVRLVKTN